MRVHVLSDLHLEQAPFTPPPPPADRPPTGTATETGAADVVVLAGDVHPGVAGVRWARDAFPRTPVLYVAGNHEFWGHRHPALVDELRAAAEGSTVRVLERDAVELGGVRFLGTTLWTDFALFGHAGREARSCARLPDFRRITADDSGRHLTPQATVVRHEEDRDWLARELAASTLPTVVVTHHAPHRRSQDPRFEGQRSSAAFSSHLEDLILARRPRLWIHGHLHWRFDYRVGDTRVVCNPRGYPGEATNGFDPGWVVEVET